MEDSAVRVRFYNFHFPEEPAYLQFFVTDMEV
jgi:hypothetical protein